MNSTLALEIASALVSGRPWQLNVTEDRRIVAERSTVGVGYDISYGVRSGQYWSYIRTSVPLSLPPTVAEVERFIALAEFEERSARGVEADVSQGVSTDE